MGELGLRYAEVLGLGAGHLAVQLRVAEQCGTAALSAYLGRLALCVEPTLAHPAVAARDLEGHDHAIAGTDLSDVATDLEHDADRLVAQDVTGLMKAPIVSYRWRSDPQMLVLVTLMMASFGSLIIGSATSSTAMSRKPCQVTAFISRVTPCASRRWSDAAGISSATCRHRPPTTLPSRNRPRAREKGDHRRDFAGVTGTTKWDTEPFLLMGILVLLASHGGCDLARSVEFAVMRY